MELQELIDTQHGVGALLASICGILILQLALKIIDMSWGSFKSLKKSVNQLDKTLQEINKELMPLMRLPQDMKRAFKAIKLISGSEWDDISKKIMEKDPLDE